MNFKQENQEMNEQENQKMNEWILDMLWMLLRVKTEGAIR